MSVNDPLIVEYYPSRGTYIILQGRETFYDHNDILVEFPTSERARDYAVSILGEEPIMPDQIDLPFASA